MNFKTIQNKIRQYIDILLPLLILLGIIFLSPIIKEDRDALEQQKRKEKQNAQQESYDKSLYFLNK